MLNGYISSRAQKLAEAFPELQNSEAVRAGAAVDRQLFDRQQCDRFSVAVGGAQVLIPYRLYFRAVGAPLPMDSTAGVMARLLQTRSNDGYERQRASADVLTDLQPFAAPFIVALIGEYVAAILEDIERALTPATVQTLQSFLLENPRFWGRTKARVVSYWNVYYRFAVPKADYVGFRLIDLLDPDPRMG